MARKPRLEVEGGLYHLITRGVDRRDIFHSPEDHQKFLALLSRQKAKLPFYLYAYCLMTNHIHLLIERRTENVGQIMHRVLTGYTQYYNRKYRRLGHLLQGRHKAILCQSDPYLAELVRYIHLNPVRAKMVRRVENYPYSSHGSYIDTAPLGLVDVDPVLRRFAPQKAVARERYVQFVAAGANLGRQEQFYEATNGVLGTDEFVDEMIHRIGEFDTRKAAMRRNALEEQADIQADLLIRTVETVCGVKREDFCGAAKAAGVVFAKEALILSGKQLGASVTALAEMMSLSSATISRRHDVARQRISEDPDLGIARDQIIQQYKQRSGHES
ncbi:MAG: transposase [Pyrinomonadaceae bacterium]